MVQQPSDPYQSDFPKSEYAARYHRLQQRMQAEGVNALIVSAKLHLRYLTGYRSPFWDMAADIQLAILPAVSGHKPTLILPASYEFTAGAAWIEDVEYFSPESSAPFNDPCDLAAAILKDKGLANGTLGMDLDVGSLENMPPSAFDRIRAQLPGASVINDYPLILELRSVKAAAELDALRVATAATADGLQAAFGQIREGMTKREFGEILCRTMLEKAGESCHMRQWLFFLGAGQDMATWCNFATSDYRFQEGDLVVADGGCSFKGYWADMMRWGSIGEPSAENQYMLDVVTEAMEAGKATLRAGVTDGQVDAVMRTIIESSHIDHDMWKMAGFSGHGIGLEIHELPRILDGGTTLLQPGMVLSIEPLLLKQVGGRSTKTPGSWSHGSPPDMMVMEDNVIVTKEGYESLTPISTSLRRGR